ncbi:MAG: hypothetical protein ABSB28_06735 [Candidatus Bathyarchaeia archaeon]
MKRKRVDLYYHPGTPESRGTVKECGLCKGTGRDTTSGPIGLRCSACGGKGWVRI